MAYFYFDFRDVNKQGLRDLVPSIPSLPLTTTITYTMDALLSQLKGQGSPFSSSLPKPNSVEKLLDTIHLLSQATVLVAHQLQEQNTPVKAKPPRETHLPTPPLTPKSSPVSSAKKTPLPKASASVLSWVPRAPEYYRLPSPNPTTSTPTSVPIPAKPILRTPHTKKDRKPKSKRTKPSTQPNPSPTPPALTNPTLSPNPITGQAQPLSDQRATPAQPPAQPYPLFTIPSRPAQTDQREPPTQTKPTPSTPPTQTDADAKAAKAAATKARRRLVYEEKVKSALAASTPTTPPPIHQDDVAPMAPSNNVVNFSHTYDNCPRLPECPAHKDKFAVSCQAYAVRTRDAILPSFPNPSDPYAGPGFELRAERDTTWWPVPPSNSSSPPGTPVDPDASFSPPPLMTPISFNSHVIELLQR